MRRSPPLGTCSWVLPALAAVLLPTAAGAQAGCDTVTTRAAASYDLYCVTMLPAAGSIAAGTAQLEWVPGPFTVPVTREGVHRWNVQFDLHDLPPLPEGPAPGFVAWVTTMDFLAPLKLGTVGASPRRLGPFAMHGFLFLISAEPDTTVTSRRGRLLARGESAGTRLRPADTYEFFLGALGRMDGGATEHDRMGHGAPDSLGWKPVPMYPGLQMLPAEMMLRPPVTSWTLPFRADAPSAHPAQRMRLHDGDTLDLTAGVVRRTIAGREYAMFGFNEQYPGPLLDVARGTRVVVRFRNRLPMPTTVHWHGLRLDARFDGVPGVSQAPVPPGGAFTYELVFPDGGLFWYHPHVREDIQQDLGLYGNIFVRPEGDAAWGAVDREEFLILDDLLIGEDGTLVPWGRDTPTHAAMGRFGNVLLVNGETDWYLDVAGGTVVRLHLTNVSNTRTFNLSFGAGARMKLIASDLGTYPREVWTDNIVIAPAERYVVDVRFEGAPGERIALRNAVQAFDHFNGRYFPTADTLGQVGMTEEASVGTHAARFDSLHAHPELVAQAAALLREHLGRPPQHTLELRARFEDLPFVTERMMRVDSIYANPVEWEGTMPGMNWSTVGTQARWTLRDFDTGLQNGEIAWKFRRGDQVRIRLLGVRQTLHAMQHPIHLHGQRFLVLAVNGIPNDNPVWKDTVLVPVGGAVDLLVELSNPGRWMLHCHIAEHLQSGMMMIIDVEEQ